MWEVGCERTPNLIYAAVRPAVLRAFSDSVSEDRQHAGYLIDTGVEAGIIGRRDDRQIVCQKDVIIEFPR